jgi:hypothetical protein
MSDSALAALRAVVRLLVTRTLALGSSTDERRDLA